jgi:hypothetical protein
LYERTNARAYSRASRGGLDGAITGNHPIKAAHISALRSELAYLVCEMEILTNVNNGRAGSRAHVESKRALCLLISVFGFV